MWNILKVFNSTAGCPKTAHLKCQSISGVYPLLSVLTFTLPSMRDKIMRQTAQTTNLDRLDLRRTLQ